MKKKFFMFLVLSLCIFLCACGGSTDTKANEETPAVSDPEPIIYFESDEVVNKLFADYNAIAEVKIPVEEIEKGNIRTKAFVYMDDFGLEIINAPDRLAISISFYDESEDETLYAVFRDIIKVTRTDTTEESIQSVWSELCESHIIEEPVFGDVRVSYFPTAQRIDLEIPLK